ncbi:hypothetical protein NIES22_66980 [Calothrix brevissima NIES-22]|nr:hypothetical protein NIES22_66980 [Calothrix brevissima NIES-22]
MAILGLSNRSALNVVIDKVAQNNAALFSRLIGVQKNSLYM